MEGTLRFDQERDNWFIDHEEHFRIVKDDKGQAYDAQTITKRVQVEPHSCPGNYPTDILNNDGTKVNFEIVTLSFGDNEYSLQEGDFAIIRNLNN